jgi:ribonuclease D
MNETNYIKYKENKMILIENTTNLISFCDIIKKEKFITIDLEFLREKTYWAKLCLIQVGSEKECAIIDPLSNDIDLAPLYDILFDENITKVFHAARQDLEIIYHLTGKIPAPIFDTQVAAMVCGFGESVSYQLLAKKLSSQNLDKSMRFSNWSKRPLDEEQLEYAISDVTHLINIYKNLKKYLIDNDRIHWVDEEMELLTNPSTYEFPPQEAWHRIKHRSTNRKFLTTLRELAAWREQRAQKNDITRKMVIKDECLLNIAAEMPKNIEELAEIRGIRSDILNGKLADEILTIVEIASNIKAKDYVKLDKKDKILGQGSSSLVDILKLLLKIKSRENDVAPKLITNDHELRSIAAGDDKSALCLKGWRYEIFGKYAIDLREGNLSFKFNPETKEIEFG